MRIARARFAEAVAWCLIEGQQARPIVGPFLTWAPRLAAGDGPGALTLTGEHWPLTSLKLLPPIERGAKVIVAGANYFKHLKEFGVAAPVSPFAFMKPYGALIGANDDILYSPLTRKLDFEVELVVVLGSALSSACDPMRAVLGYAVGNDVSARDLQTGPGGALGMDLLSGKGLDRTTGVGPWIVTRDEFGDETPDLRLTLKVNGEQRQDARTSEMRWNVAELLAYIEARTSWEPGDILFTGTPAGVGQADGRFLDEGDVVEATVERIGALRNIVRRATAGVREFD